MSNVEGGVRGSVSMEFIEFVEFVELGWVEAQS
jgi:hypothetical protein